MHSGPVKSTDSVCHQIGLLSVDVVVIVVVVVNDEGASWNKPPLVKEEDAKCKLYGDQV